MPNYSLNFEDVLCIRYTYSLGGVTMAELAKEYDVTVANISLIIRRETWKKAEKTASEN